MMLPPRPRRKEDWDDYRMRLEAWLYQQREAQWGVMARALDVDAAAFQQVVDWARAWVQNETCIEEAQDERLRPSERDGLKLLREWGVL